MIRGEKKNWLQKERRLRKRLKRNLFYKRWGSKREEKVVVKTKVLLSDHHIYNQPAAPAAMPLPSPPAATIIAPLLLHPHTN